MFFSFDYVIKEMVISDLKKFEDYSQAFYSTEYLKNI